MPNITQKGLSDWSEKDIAYFLETGQTPDGDSAGGSMVSVIRNISQLSEADRAAIADYVKSLPPVEGPPRPRSQEQRQVLTRTAFGRSRSRPASRAATSGWR